MYYSMWAVLTAAGYKQLGRPLEEPGSRRMTTCRFDGHRQRGPGRPEQPRIHPTFNHTGHRLRFCRRFAMGAWVRVTVCSPPAPFPANTKAEL
ncbi:hypothetical protein VTK56DRAFT_9965 [Thermocarpiscus australiensis]